MPPARRAAAPARAAPPAGARAPAGRSGPARAAGRPRARGDARAPRARAPPDGAAAGPRRGRFENANLAHGASAARRSRRIARPVRRPCEAICFRAAERALRRSAKPPLRRDDRGRQGQAVARPVPLELELSQAGGHRMRHALRLHSPRTPIALALLTPPPSVACRCSSPGRTRAKQCLPAAARPGTVRRVGSAPQPFARVSRTRCAPC